MLLVFCLPSRAYVALFLLSLALQVSTTPAPLCLPSVSVLPCLEEEGARVLVPQVSSNAWDHPPIRQGTQPLNACLLPPPPPLQANSLQLIDWPSHTGRELQWLCQWFSCTAIDTYRCLIESGTVWRIKRLTFERINAFKSSSSFICFMDSMRGEINTEWLQ